MYAGCVRFVAYEIVRVNAYGEMNAAVVRQHNGKFFLTAAVKVVKHGKV